MTTNNDDLSNKEDVVVKEQQPTTTYAELYEKLYPKPDTEQLKKNAKHARTRNIIAALGDGISAIANLHYTTKGAPNMYDGKSTLTAKSQARYDKLMQDYKDNLDKYKQGQLKAEQLDKEWNHRAEREKVADEHWDKDYTYRENRDNQSQENWKKTYDLQKQTQQDNKQFRQDQIDAQNKRTEAARAKGVRGKETVFSDGKGNNVIIYDNVWKGSKQSIINALSEDPQFQDNLLLRKINRGIATKDEVDNFINQNWYKSDKAKAIMLTLSQLDPATMTSEIDNDSKELNWGSSNNNQDLDW